MPSSIERHDLTQAPESSVQCPTNTSNLQSIGQSTSVQVTRGLLLVHEDDTQTRLSRALHPLVDRPVIQHAIESLVRQGITTIDVLVASSPDQIEQFLGDGTRWGINLRYYLSYDSDRPFEPCQHIDLENEDAVALMRADVFYPGSIPLLTEDGRQIPAAYVQAHANGENWAGLAVIPADQVSHLAAGRSFSQLEAALLDFCRHEGRTVQIHGAVDATTFTALLDTQHRALNGQISDLVRTRAEYGIALGRNVSIHNSATLRPPVFIGDHTFIGADAQIGPNVVICNECVIDEGTSIQNSLVLPKTSIGEKLELHDSIANGSQLTNVRLGATLNVADDFLIGDLDARTVLPTTGRTISRVISAVVYAVTLPLIALTWMLTKLAGTKSETKEIVVLPVNPGREKQLFNMQIHSTTAHRSDARAHTSVRRTLWKHLFTELLPGLRHVINGHISVVGVTPQTLLELEALPEEWKQLVLQSRAGLITESLVQFGTQQPGFERQLADAHYAVKASFLHDLRIIGKYISRLIRG